MKLRKILSLILCLNLIFLCYGFASSAYDNSNPNDDAETNVITASDAGGGDLTGAQILLIILASVGVFFVILLLLAAAA